MQFPVFGWKLKRIYDSSVEIMSYGIKTGQWYAPLPRRILLHHPQAMQSIIYAAMFALT
jgi:hypothetical protein